MYINSTFLLLLSLLAFFSPCPKELKAEDPYRLGFITILSGPYSEFGQASANAAQLAIEDFQKTHPDQKVKFLLEDDGADQRKGLSAYLKLRDFDKADSIMPISTFGIGAVKDLVNREKRPTFIVGNEPYEPEDDFIFMLSPDAISAQRSYGVHIADKHPEGALVVVASENEAVHRFARALREGTKDRAIIIDIPAQSSNFATIALKIKNMNPKALAFCGFAKDSAGLLKELQKLNFMPELYFDDTIGNSFDEFKTIFPKIEILRNASLLKMTSESDSDFLARYEKRFAVPAVAWMDYVYDSVALTLQLKDLPSTEAIDWVKQNTYKGVSGLISFDERGVRKPLFSIQKLRDDPRFLELKTS